MPTPRCQHGDSAPRYKDGRCKICKRIQVADRQRRLQESGERAIYEKARRERLKVERPELHAKRLLHKRIYTRIRRGKSPMSLKNPYPCIGVRCVCGKPAARTYHTGHLLAKPMYCSVACREADTLETCRRIIEGLQSGRHPLRALRL